MTRPLTKTDFLAGIQCPLRLWNRHLAPIPYEEREQTPAMTLGTSVGQLAHRLFPGGILVEAEPWAREESVSTTWSLLEDETVPALFEAGFLHDGLHSRVDVLKRKASGAFALYEVKSSGRVKDHYIPDLAFQVHVARWSGLKIDEAVIVHINKEYERGIELDVRDLFAFSDETKRVEEYLASIDEALRNQKHILIGASPAVEPGGQCFDPYQCEFWERCTDRTPEDWIFYLPRLRHERYEELQALGIESIRAIPDDFNLSELQARIREVLRTGKPYFGPGLADALAEVQPPLSYLDFETVNPAVPIWRGTYPFQRIPFQWSLHQTAESGALTHADFLATGSVDPRRAVAESLVEHLGSSDESIVVYHKAFESGVLRDLADLYVDLAPKLLGIRDRLWDLLPVVRKHVYLPEFGGSFSIKSVAPALVPGIRYEALNGVKDGMAASDAFIRLVSGKLADGQMEDEIRKSLLTYCHLDTLAMVRVYQTLQQNVGYLSATNRTCFPNASR